MVKTVEHFIGELCMVEKMRERQQESQSENALSPKPPQNDTYFSYIRQLQNEVTEESMGNEEKQREIEV